MSFDKFRIEPSPFATYYDVFLRNALQGREFKLKLKNGAEGVGVPMAGSMADPTSPNVSFSFKMGGQVYQVPFADLESAEPVE